MQKGFAGLIVLIVVLILVGLGGAYYFGKSQNLKPQPQNSVVVSQAPQPIISVQPTSVPDETVYTEASRSANWKTYTNTRYGYSVKYSAGLSQNEISGNDTYLSIVTFKGLGEDNEWFSVQVRNSTLEDEIRYQKSQIEGHISVKLAKETAVTLEDFSGVLLEYTPDQPDIGSISRFVIVNNGKYSYIISGLPETLDQILSTFKFTR